MITMADARRAYKLVNDAGNGYAPYPEAGDEVYDVLAAAEADGGEVILARETNDDVAVLRMSDGGLLAIGSDATGRAAWAVDLANVATDAEIKALRNEAAQAGDFDQAKVCDAALARPESIAKVEARIACAFAIDDAKAFLDVARRRLADADAGTAKMLTLDEVRARLDKTRV